MSTRNGPERPTPGSDKALAAGCTCPVLDNNYGAGHGTLPDGRTAYVYNLSCPLHITEAPGP